MKPQILCRDCYYAIKRTVDDYILWECDLKLLPGSKECKDKRAVNLAFVRKK